MSFHRVVCLSSPNPTNAPHEVLAVCHHFPSRNAQSGVGGKLLCLGEQQVMLLEGKRGSLNRLVERIQAEAPEAGLTIRARSDSEERAFSAWNIEDLYLDEVAGGDQAAAERLCDLVIDLLAGVETDDDPFSELASLVEHAAAPKRLPLAAA